MRIAIVHPRTTLYGGAELMIVKLANYLAGKGHQVDYFTTGFPEGMESQFTKKGVVTFNIGSRKNNKVTDAFNIWDTMPCFAGAFDLINYHNFPATLGHHDIWSKTPAVWYCNEPPELFSSWWRKPVEFYNHWLVKRNIKNVVVADSFNQRRFKKLYGFSPYVIPYGVDYDFWSQGEDIPHNRFTVVQVGTVSYYKNQMASVQAVEQVKKEIPDIRLIIVGKVCDDYGKSVVTYVKNNNLSDNVFFTGHLNRTEVRDWYKRSDLVLHPVKAQGGWLTPFEAIAAGRPVIVSPEITCADMINKHALALVDADYRWAILASRINKQNKASLRQRYFVKEVLSWDRFGASMEEYFKGIVR